MDFVGFYKYERPYTYNRYEKDFKEEVVKFAADHGSRAAATFFKVSDSSVCEWRKAMDATKEKVKELKATGGYLVTSTEYQEVVRKNEELTKRDRKLDDEWELKEQINMCLQDICQNLLDGKNMFREIVELQEERQSKHQPRIDKLKLRLERNELKLKYFEERFDILTQMEYNKSKLEIENEDYRQVAILQEESKRKKIKIKSSKKQLKSSHSERMTIWDSQFADNTQIENQSQPANADTTIEISEEGDNEFTCDNDDVIRVMSRNIDVEKVRVLNLGASLLEVLDRCDEKRDPMKDRTLPFIANNSTEISAVQRQTEPLSSETITETIPNINDSISELSNDLSEAAKENSFELQLNETKFESNTDGSIEEKSCESNWPRRKTLLGEIFSFL